MIKFEIFIINIVNGVRYFRGRVSNFNQSEARKHCFLASNWLKVVALPASAKILYSMFLCFKLRFLFHFNKKYTLR